MLFFYANISTLSPSMKGIIARWMFLEEFSYKRIYEKKVSFGDKNCYNGVNFDIYMMEEDMMKERKKEKRGPKEQFLDKDELNIAYVFMQLYPNKKLFRQVYEYDSNSDREKVNKSDLRTIQRARKEIRNMKNMGVIYMEVKCGIDKQKLIEMILDTYPDPDFFTEKIQGTNNWTGKLMVETFNKDNEYFKLQYNRKVIFYISGINFTEKEYQKGIDTYIESAKWENLFSDVELSERYWSFQLEIIPIEDEKLELAPRGKIRKCAKKSNRLKRKKGHFYQEYGDYSMDVTNLDTKIVKKRAYLLKAPKYKGNEQYYIDKDEYFNHNLRPDFVCYPLTSMAGVQINALEREGDKEDYKYYRDNLNTFFNKIFDNVRSKTGFNSQEYKGKVCLLYRASEDFVFILGDTVRNAKIAREWENFARKGI